MVDRATDFTINKHSSSPQENASAIETDHLQMDMNGNGAGDMKSAKPLQKPQIPNIKESSSSRLGMSGGIMMENVRRGFIRKVLVIILIQFSISISMVVAAMYSAPFKKFQSDYIWVLLAAILLEIVLFIALSCYKQNCRKVPRNYICLVLFTISMSYILSFICARVAEVAVLISTISTALVVLALILYSLFSKKDITKQIGFILFMPIGAIILIMFLSMWPAYITQVIISLILVGVFSIYLVFDIQRLTGKFEIEYSIDDYIIAALEIYIDIVMLFKQTLICVASKS